MIPQGFFHLCHQSSTVSSKLQESLTATPSDVYETLYKHSRGPLASEPTDTPDDVLGRAAPCGRWPGKPSRLFLQAFADALTCLQANPLAGMVSPPLMGSHGTIPLTTIAPLAEVARHCAEMIKQARREVFFVTCVWTPSEAQRSIKNSLVELSERAGAREEKVAIRVIYDQASPWHAFESHMKLKPEAYDNLLPRPEEVPNLDLQVVSLHTMFLGTLHAKYCVVDNRIALIMSNNVEDNQNLEMLTHLEGPVVASIRDSALITWSKRLGELGHQGDDTEGNSVMEDDEVHQSYLKQLVKEANMRYEGEDLLEATNKQLNVAFKTQIQPSGPGFISGHEMTPFVWTQTESTVPIALVSRPAYGGLDHGDTGCPQNEAWLSLVRGAERSIFIQTPDLNRGPMISALADALARGVEVTYYFCFGYNDCGEMIPGQGGTNEQAARKLMALAQERVRCTDHSLEKLLRIHAYVAKDQDHPVHHSLRQRDCHLKLLIVDEAVGVQGSGNQDTQSWCHSQELNIMVDSREICSRWRHALERNQRTASFGGLAGDGIWRDEKGRPGQGYSGDPGMVGGLLKGVVGMSSKTLRQRFSAH